MSSGKNPLMLMMALSMPGASHALGLGDIHVDSALNERFAAEIDIVGATALELADLRASVANRDIFLRYGADRPAFLSSATFKVTQDAQGRPVLAVRSTESFTDPVVNFLVDLSWRNGELVRQYTLLLDPSGFSAARLPAILPASVSTQAPKSSSAPVAGAVIEAQAPHGAAEVDPPARTARKMTHIKVGANATLRGIAWRVGERSETDLQRMMIAIFRANPSAFDGNINRLHRGALLTIPSHAQLASISKAEAKQEVHAQMIAWHSPVRMAAAAQPSVPAVPVAPVVAALADDGGISNPADALERRVQSLEHELNDVRGLLQSKHDEIQAMQEEVARAEKPVPAAASVDGATDSVAVESRSDFSAVAIAAGLGVLASALAALYFKLRRRPVPPRVALVDLEPTADAPAAGDAMSFGPGAIGGAAIGGTAPGAAALNGAAESAAAAQEHGTSGTHAAALGVQEYASDATTQQNLKAMKSTTIDDATQPLLPIVSTGEPARMSTAAGSVSRASAQDPTVNPRVDTVNLRIDPTRLDYNLVDLDMTAQHVQMPSVLNEQVVMKERRTNLADVLRLAIEREPDRHDLRMKLLELYYSAASTNRQAFLEVVQKFARDRDYLQADQWDKIAFMGRQIAAENPLFAEDTAADDIADCA